MIDRVPTLKWKPTGKDAAWLWVVQLQTRGAWTTRILPAGTQSLALNANSPESKASEFAVSAVDRYGQRSAPSSTDMDDDPDLYKDPQAPSQPSATVHAEPAPNKKPKN